MDKQPITQEAIEQAANEIIQKAFLEFRKTFIDNLEKDPLNPDHVYSISKNVADSLLATLTKQHMDNIKYKYQLDRRPDVSALYYKVLIETETRNIEKYQQQVLYPMLQEARLKARRDFFLKRPQMEYETRLARGSEIRDERLRRGNVEMARQAEEIRDARARQQQESMHQQQERDREEYARQEQARQAEEERARQEYARQEQERARQQDERPRPPTGAGNEKSRLAEELSKYGITNRSSYKKWSVKNHPDRFGGQAQEQIDRQTALFKDVQQYLEKLKEIDPENAVFKFIMGRKTGRRGMSQKSY